ncbi:MAG: hypothetical protein HC786_28455 [Richelia sp. CSU_2_1]|nr:hypothetical protein [Richelia sp. CSU_2_1]
MALALDEIRKSIVFAVEGRLSTLQNEVPNYSRMSPAMLETQVNSSIVLLPFQSNIPTINPTDGSILLEPGRTNLLNYNLDFRQSVWQKGSNVTVRGDVAIAPDGSHRGDLVSWGVGTGNTQLIQRSVTLKAGTPYYLSALVELIGGKFAAGDEIRMTGGVVGTPKVSFSSLNAYTSSFRWLELAFTTLGTQPKLPEAEVGQGGYPIASVSANSVTVSGITGIANNNLIGGQLGFPANNATKRYSITGNTVSGTSCTIVTDPASGSLVADGVTATHRAQIYGAPDVVSLLQFYVGSAVSIVPGGIQLEEGTFRTSTIYQDATISPRAPSSLVYRKQSNPLFGLKTFGILLDLKFWRGDGVLFVAGNINADIVGGKLRLAVGTTVIEDSQPLPTNPQIYIQVSGESFTLSLFVNKKAVSRSNLAGFVPSNSSISLTTAGVRCFNRIVILNRAFADGSVALGETVKSEMADVLFSEITDVSTVATTVPELVLPLVTIPSPEMPAASSEIQAINSAGRTVTVVDGSGFGTSGSVIVFRTATDGDRAIGYLTITGRTGNTISLDSVSGIALGDRLVSDFVARPGKASVRLPFSPIDPQVISAVDSGNRRVTVSSALAFVEKERAIVQSSVYQDVAEVIVETVDNTNNRLTLNSVSGISIGDIIAQPDEESGIPPECYYVDLLSPNPAINIEQKALNGFVLSNRGTGEAIVQATVKVYL